MRLYLSTGAWGSLAMCVGARVGVHGAGPTIGELVQKFNLPSNLD